MGEYVRMNSGYDGMIMIEQSTSYYTDGFSCAFLILPLLCLALVGTVDTLVFVSSILVLCTLPVSRSLYKKAGNGPRATLRYSIHDRTRGDSAAVPPAKELRPRNKRQKVSKHPALLAVLCKQH